jgi:anti-anti-sigma regulatory factor/HAMP domain-containing protein
MKIRTKFIIIVAGIAIISAGASSIFGLWIAQKALEKHSFNHLTSVRETKANEIENYFDGIFGQVATFSHDRMIIDAMKAFEVAFEEIDRELDFDESETETCNEQLRQYYQAEFLPRLNENIPERAYLPDYWPLEKNARLLQCLYLARNSFPTGEKHFLDRSGASSTYDKVHKLYHPIIRDYLQSFGYYDIFLIDHETGHIVYSVFKEVDFGTSLLSGPYRKTNFANAFRAAAAAPNKEFVWLEDFKTYDPSYGAHASFIASPIFDGSRIVGVLVFQMPTDRINDIMTSKESWSTVGLGDSGETYIVGEDFTVRSQARFLVEDRDRYLQMIAEVGLSKKTVERIASLDTAIGLQEVRTEGSSAALSGATGTKIIKDYRGVEVLSAFAPLAIQQVNWAILSEMDVTEAFEASTILRNAAIGGLAILAVLSIVVATGFAGTLTRPLRLLSDEAAELAGGNLDREIKIHGADEIGQLANSFRQMQGSLRELVERQASAIDALSTPIIPLHEKVFIMPLVGDLDENRVNKLGDSLVNGLHATGAKIAIIDLTGVPPFNEMAAKGLVDVTVSAGLMGAQVIMTGMKPELASVLVELDLRLDGIVTKRSLQDGIAYAMAQVEKV